MNSATFFTPSDECVTSAKLFEPIRLTHWKLFCMSKATLGKKSGSVTMLEGITCMVWPSGADLASASMPIAPAAPTRFSTTKGWFQRALKRGASSRAMTSGVVDADCARSRCTGRDDRPCARDRRGAPARTADAPTISFRLIGFMIVLLVRERGADRV